MDNGQWQWTMDNGQWTMDNGQWAMADILQPVDQWTMGLQIRQSRPQPEGQEGGGAQGRAVSGVAAAGLRPWSGKKRRL
ncbi:MAG: hypothetical protein LBB49_01175, partial [Gracilibacteraceae bacterium]|nr:hypothetical protein [Gracilibacteraceae bacterium]